MQLSCPHCKQILEFSQQQPRFCSHCGGPLSTAPGPDVTVHYDAPPYDPNATRAFPPGQGEPTAPPQTVGGYRLVRAIGSGGMGTVYEAEEIATHRRVALKLIRHEFAASSDALERFRREGRLAGTIVHPRCVFVLAADEDAGRPYIVMELMPGETLADLVERRGPLPPQEAVALVLDAIEGLQEAHRCGLIHRDVKPSNCFLDADGRVKIGDFGLAKSLIGQQGGLTQTGSFLGTVLFAAPEQIRNDKVDRQADVYSVAATLYFLLTGKAPFETDDPAATLARTLSDPLTPMRQLRAELPRTLDDVVLRGLARPRERRWQGMEGFRLALLPFVPGTHTLGEIGWRFTAYLVDAFAFTFLEVVLFTLLELAPRFFSPAALVGVEITVRVLTFLIWFAIPEKLWGCSLGKWLFRLRVRGDRSDDRPTWKAVLLRALLFWLPIYGLPRMLDGLIPLFFVPRPGAPVVPDVLTLLVLLALEFAAWMAWFAGIGLIASTMRRRNGYRGLHEILSGTKVIRLPRAETEQGLFGPVKLPAPNAEKEDFTDRGIGFVRPASSRFKKPERGLAGQPKQKPLAVAIKDFPERVGAFSIRSCLRSTADEQVLLGVDEVLDREVWIWLRPAAASASTAERCAISRTTRSRWLASGQLDNRQWDVFVASPGCLLSDLVKIRRRLFWPEVRPVLEQLAEELSHSCDEGALPPALSVGQIWVQSTGRVQLLDTPLRDAGDEAVQSAANVQRRGLAMLLHAATLMLEGKPRASLARPTALRAPVPRYALEPLARLVGISRPFARVGDFLKALQGVRDRPPAVTKTRRGISLVLQAALLFIGVGTMLPISLNATYGAFASTYLVPWLIGEIAREDLDDDIRQDVALLVETPDPVACDLLAAQLDEDLRVQSQLDQDLALMRRRRRLALQSSSLFVEKVVNWTEQRVKAALRKTVQSIKGPTTIDYVPIVLEPDPHQNAENIHKLVLERGDAWNVVTWQEAVEQAAPLFVWPALWLFWAGLTRGGVCLPLAGVALVQKNGRRAARWRCTVRAAAVWMPFVVLLVVSLFLDIWRISPAAPTDWGLLRLLAWLAWVTWWLALAWLPVHVVLTLRWPNRGWHDWIAGTYLVPR